MDSERLFRVGKITPPAPDAVWDDPDEWPPEVPNEMWLLQIDFYGNIGDMDTHDGMIEVRGETKEVVEFVAQQIIDKLNDPKTQFVQKLKIG
jgi:hypothetical protein